MKRVKLIVAYDGTNYCGWQIQPNGITIEQVLNEQLSRFFKEDIKVTGASRTDAGVHSLGNVCIFDTDTRMPAEKISYAINQSLPEDIVVVDSCEVDREFHPRFSKSRKTYEYRILNRRINMPMERLYSHFCYYKLDVDRMQAAANMLAGEHDFKSFCSVRTQVTDTVRNVYRIDVTRNEDDIITIRVTGNGFLYNMVRIIAGTLLEVGRGNLEVSKIADIIASKDRANAGPTAPAKGLKLMQIEYL